MRLLSSRIRVSVGGRHGVFNTTSWRLRIEEKASAFLASGTVQRSEASLLLTGQFAIDFRQAVCFPDIRMIPKVGITSFSGKSSVIVDTKYEKSLREHLQEAGLEVREVVACDRRILGFNWEDNDLIPIIDPSLEKTSEVWIRLEDPSHRAGQLIASWFDRQIKEGSFSAG